MTRTRWYFGVAYSRALVVLWALAALLFSVAMVLKAVRGVEPTFGDLWVGALISAACTWGYLKVKGRLTDE